MLKKIKFSVFNVFIATLLIMAAYYIIIALQAEGLNLSGLFALICFILAFVLFGIRVIIRYFFKDLKKVKIAEVVLLTIVSLIFFYFCIILLELNGFLP